MADRSDAYASAFLAVISAEDSLGEVEDELFRFARILEGNDELLETLSDPHIEPARRQQIVTDLLEGKAQPTTVNLVGLVVGNGRARELPAIVDTLVGLRAASRESAVARVRSAVALSDEQTSRLAEALARATGKNVEVKVVVDPTVQGGLVAEVGDTVLDGTVRRRLEQLRAAF
ncbi:ATP synthase F1 subunit delta [Iamia sp. SCSIO 61187]|uniref:ATP synthase F1 subunit delta n=1 Tax=Iamia sp. SCSIO 61187 TaxID=2722752 RepID=UPI001C636F7E|nr:ATP synthase F1 subunit delta [Iamia sp. SCSIO 61187]QYG94594.1 ATP synthase F1 subunit delta [Iamia sp. SCSIO 61187]